MDERSHEWRVSFMVVGHGLNVHHSVSYRGKTFVSSVYELAVGPTLHPLVWVNLSGNVV